MNVAEVITQVEKDPTFALALLRGLALVQVASPWTLGESGTMAYRTPVYGPFYGLTVCFVQYEVPWDAGEPLNGRINITVMDLNVGSITLPDVDSEAVFKAVDKKDALARYLQIAMQTADDFAKVRGWVLP